MYTWKSFTSQNTIYRPNTKYTQHSAFSFQRIATNNCIGHFPSTYGYANVLIIIIVIISIIVDGVIWWCPQRVSLYVPFSSLRCTLKSFEWSQFDTQIFDSGQSTTIIQFQFRSEIISCCWQCTVVIKRFKPDIDSLWMFDTTLKRYLFISIQWTFFLLFQ